MIIELNRKKFAEALGLANGALSSRSTLPILSNILLEAADNRLKITGTDLDITTTMSIICDVKKSGTVTLPARKLTSIIGSLEAEQVEIEVDEKHDARIRCGASNFKANGLSPDEYPPCLPVTDEKLKFSMTQSELRRCIRMVSYAMSTDTSRYILNGMLIEIREAKMNLITTDGRRLAIVTAECDADAEMKGLAVIPTKAVNELSRLLKDEGIVDIKIGERGAQFTMRDDTGVYGAFVSKLIEGNFPNYQQVIPPEMKTTIKLPREELHAVIKRASIMTNEKSSSVKLSFDKNLLVITANAPGVGDGREEMACSYKDKPCAIAYNPDYLLDALASASEDEVEFQIIDELSPAKLVWPTSNAVNIIMPMRLS